VFLHDWHDDELTAFAWQSLPVSKAAKGNALADVQSLRRCTVTIGKATDVNCIGG
jgi:hypothetical protein